MLKYHRDIYYLLVTKVIFHLIKKVTAHFLTMKTDKNEP